MKSIRWLCAASIAISALTASAAPITSGTIIGIDFGPTDPTNNYNKIDDIGGGAFGAFIDLDGTSIDTVGLTVGATVTFSNNDGTSQDLANYPAVLDVNDSNTTDWIGAGTPNPHPRTFTLTWTGLDDALTYDVYGISSFSSNLGTIWAAGAQSVLTVTDSTSGGTLAYLEGLETDGAGNLLITVTATPNNVAVANAMVLVAVPEPSVVVVSAFGLAALVGCMRRRRLAR